MIKKHY